MRNDATWLCVFLFACGCAKEKTLTVSVQVVEVKTTQDREYYTCGAVIKNETKTTIKFVVWSCSHEINWISDNDAVQMYRQPCFSNYTYDVSLEPGEDFKTYVRVFLEKSFYTRPSDFRLGFIPDSYEMEEKLGPFWSNPVETVQRSPTKVFSPT